MSSLPHGEPSGSRRLQEFVDWPSGTIRARGRLSPQGADLIRGTAELLRRSGHAPVTVDLRAVRIADGEALDALRVLAADLRARSGKVLLPPGPPPPVAGPRPRFTRRPR